MPGSTEGWDRIMHKARELDRLHVRVGVLQSKGGSASAGKGITIAGLAAVHEYGSAAAGVPERSFVRSTMRTSAEDIGRLTERLARSYLSDEATLEQVLNKLGAFVAARVKRTITTSATEGPGPQELKPKTIERKGSSKPLVDEGQLLGAISWEVK